MEQAYRFEEAARIYEELDMYEEAGRMRRMDRTVESRVKLTAVSLDLNDLLDQVKKGGLTVTYSCPNCRAPLRISGDTRPSGLKACKYCGSTIETTGLTEFLQRVLS
ncbi:MAG: hypothetical protein A3K65_01700 [Euryarchaeota archaeon RBG_16_68_12]|nr:MAG: hypothetical protein A3K65_01700 [Euryarchaeota archaeon RBG_16_68_12]